MKHKKLILELLATVSISAVITIIAFCCNGIYLGSEKTVLILDMGAEYLPYFAYLRQIGEGYNSIMFQHLSGLGGGFFGTWANCMLSPLSLFTLFGDLIYLPDVLYVLTIIKISLCGISFFIFLRYGHIKCDKSIICIISGVTYALISYNLMYSMCFMLLDGVILLPIVMLGADRIFQKDKELLFIISLSSAIMINYYTAFMIILFVVVYYLYFAVYQSYGPADSVRKGFRFLKSGIVSVLLSAWVLIPVIFDLQRGKFDGNASVLQGLIRSPLMIFRQFLPFSKYSFYPNGAPSFYCGILVAGFIVLYLLKCKSLRKRLAAIMVLFIFFISFCWDKGDILWHGFQIPTFFPARYSYVFSFFIIMISAEFLTDRLSDELIKKFSVGLVLLLLVHMIDLGGNAIRIIRFLDTDNITGGYLKRTYYNFCVLEYDELKSLAGDSYSRVLCDYDYSCNDGLLFGVPSLDYYSSSYNNRLSNFYREIGLKSAKLQMTDTGINPVSATLLGVRYFAGFMKTDVDYSSAMLFEKTDLSDNITLYENPYDFSLGYCLDSTANDDSHLYNSFENLNAFVEDASGIGNVFIKCDTDVRKSISDDGLAIRKTYTVKPEKGMHLYFYVSPEDYMNGSGRCYDLLSVNGNQIARYENTYFRYIVDMGVCDEDELIFTLDCTSEDSEVWFYSLNEETYFDSMNELSDDSIHNIKYSSDGISGEFNAGKNTDLLILLPFEKGYTIFVDGVNTDYSSYRDALITVPVSEGEHSILIKYITPGLKAGLLISICTLLVYAGVSVIINSKNRRDNSINHE